MIERIIKWNIDRCIPQEFNKAKEAGHIAEELSEFLRGNTLSEDADALCDIIVFAVGAMWKRGIDPTKAIEETLKEIEDRGGYYDVKLGKWLKVEKEDRYRANYQKCRYEE